MKTIYLDECGYTGEDLYNEEQPFFILASIDYSEEECQELYNRHFSLINADELKHTNLKRSSRNQNLIIGFLEEVLNDETRYQVIIAHKRYVLLQKIVDYIIEPYFYENGIDLYVGGLNIAMSNMLYFCLPLFGGDDFFKKLLFKFQNFMRKRDLTTCNIFFDHVNINTENENLKILLEYLRISRQIITSQIIKLIPPKALDLPFTIGLEMVSKWSSRINDEILLIHDQSSDMVQEVREWNAITTYPKEQKLGWDVRTLQLPLRVKETLFCDSKDHIGLQLVDIIAGATAYYSKNRLSNNQGTVEYCRKLEGVLNKMVFSTSLMPSKDITPKELGTVGPKYGDPHIFLGDLAQKAQKENT